MNKFIVTFCDNDHASRATTFVREMKNDCNVDAIIESQNIDKTIVQFAMCDDAYNANFDAFENNAKCYDAQIDVQIDDDTILTYDEFIDSL